MTAFFLRQPWSWTAAAPPYVNLVLLLEIGMGLGLLGGALLARMRRFRAHACCQSIIVLLNFGVILLVMLPSFRDQVSPGIPLKLGKSYYGIALAHAALGSVAECAALYTVLAAATKLLPDKLRITRYKFWMRIVLMTWWVALILGLATYSRWYIPHSIARNSTSQLSIRISPPVRALQKNFGRKGIFPSSSQ